MFNVGGGEVLAIALIALIVLGPQRLPGAARQIGKTMGDLRRISAGFQNELRSALDEADDPSRTATRRDPLGVDAPALSSASPMTTAVDSVSTQAAPTPRKAPAAKKPAAKKPAAKKPAAKKPAARKAVPAKKAGASKKAPTKKGAVSKQAPRRSPR